MFALGFWVQVLPPAQAVAMVMVVSVGSGAQGVWLVRHEIKPPRLARFVVPAVFGIPLGNWLLQSISAEQLKLTLAFVLLLYGGYFSLRRTLPRWSHVAPAKDIGVGFLGGIMSGATGMSGVIPTMWCALHDWSKAAQRAVLQPFNMLILSGSIALLAWQGAYHTEVLKLLAILYPVTLLSAQAGLWVFKRLSDHAFQRLLVGLMLLTGLGLLVRTAWV